MLHARERETTLYDDAHVAIARLIGRTHNNPLGDTAFPLLRQLLPDRPRVLDVGCGRGASARWWGREAGARVLGLDPAPAMVAEAERLAAGEGLQGLLEFRGDEVAGARDGAVFDLALVHDVLCYVPDKRGFLEHVARQVRPGGLISVTDYHADAVDPVVEAIVAAWGIVTPPTFDAMGDLLASVAGTRLLQIDSTGQYRRHWLGVRRALDARREVVRREVGPEAVERFETQIDAILSAVREGAFGHLWSVLKTRS